MYCAVCCKQICVYNTGEVSGNQGSDLLENQIKITRTINVNGNHSHHKCHQHLVQQVRVQISQQCCTNYVWQLKLFKDFMVAI
jgi:hypothetical protein